MFTRTLLRLSHYILAALALALGLCWLMLADRSLTPLSAHAAPTAPTFIVNSTFDLVASAPLDNGICETPVGNGICTLRAAIMKANHYPDGGVMIRFGLPGTVTYTLTIPPSILDDEQTGDLNITNTLTIIGNGAGNTIIDGNSYDRVFNVGTGITATISGVTIKNGRTFSCGGGGGIFNAGRLTLSNSTVTGNTGDCSDRRVIGGGIANELDGVLTVTNSIISGNAIHGVSLEVSAEGGGIYTAGPLTLVNSTVSGNVSFNDSVNGGVGIGGGLFAVEAPVTITRSTIDGNTSTAGGGLYFDSGSGTIRNSTIDGNLAASNGGGMSISNNTLVMINSTVSGNSANSSGGGIFMLAGTMSLYNATLTGNLANADANGGDGGGGISIENSSDYGIVNFQNSIIAGNNRLILIVGHLYLNPDDCSGTITSQGNNLMRTTSGCTVNGGGVTFTDPMLGPLVNNGGPTQTHALLPGSSAIDAGNPSGCLDNFGALLTTDQRGAPRPADGAGTWRCDIGAFEVQRVLYLPLIHR